MQFQAWLNDQMTNETVDCGSNNVNYSYNIPACTQSSWSPLPDSLFSVFSSQRSSACRPDQPDIVMYITATC